MATQDKKSTNEIKAGQAEPSKNAANDGAYIRPSERMFRRSRSAQIRRKQAARKEEKFMRLVFGIAAAGIMFVGALYFMATQMAQAAPLTSFVPNGAAAVHITQMTVQNSDVVAEIAQKPILMQAIVGEYTLIDLMGLAFVIVGGYAVWRKFLNKD